jgi:hypothetical protein
MDDCFVPIPSDVRHRGVASRRLCDDDSVATFGHSFRNATRMTCPFRDYFRVVHSQLLTFGDSVYNNLDNLRHIIWRRGRCVPRKERETDRLQVFSVSCNRYVDNSGISRASTPQNLVVRKTGGIRNQSHQRHSA